MKEHRVDRPDKTSIIGCIETYEVDPSSAVAAPEKRCYTVEDLQIILACGRETVYTLLKKNSAGSVLAAVEVLIVFPRRALMNGSITKSEKLVKGADSANIG